MLVENYTQYPAQWPETWPLAQFLYAPTGAVLKHKERENHIVRCMPIRPCHISSQGGIEPINGWRGGLRQYFVQNLEQFNFDINLLYVL